ncbi:MAG: glycerol-3-phosphate 1-O-acyltransferase PlsY [Proteobacteria bacterium]|nr:glycerol-3-phosphate 1-O-acyltransferase PlsY [Pseudomonadota bacterium]
MPADFPLWLYVAALAGGYLAGSIPFGLVLTKLAGLGDIRSIGSGNIGATNVLRTGRKGLAAATLLLDGGKGAIIVVALKLLTNDPLVPLIGGFGAILGHNFPVWLKFKGGKGVATTFGVMIAAAPIIGVMACATWIIVAAIARISSLSALVALALAPIYAYFFGYPNEAIEFAALGILGWIRHASNLQRLLRGEEPRIGAKK